MKNVKKVLLSAILTASIIAPSSAQALNPLDIMYAEAYNQTMKALELKTQDQINKARVAINILPNELNEYKGEFNKQVDRVQHPILVEIVNNINKAIKEVSQDTINEARKAIPDGLPDEWKGSYSSAIDTIQQKYLNQCGEAAVKALNSYDENDIKKARTMFQDIKNVSGNEMIKVYISKAHNTFEKALKKNIVNKPNEGKESSWNSNNNNGGVTEEAKETSYKMNIETKGQLNNINDKLIARFILTDSEGKELSEDILSKGKVEATIKDDKGNIIDTYVVNKPLKDTNDFNYSISSTKNCSEIVATAKQYGAFENTIDFKLTYNNKEYTQSVKVKQDIKEVIKYTIQTTESGPSIKIVGDIKAFGFNLKDGENKDLTQDLMNKDNIKVYVTDAKGKHFVYGNGADESPTEGRDFDFEFSINQNVLSIISKSKQTGVFENSIEVITTVEGKDYSHTYTVNQDIAESPKYTIQATQGGGIITVGDLVGFGFFLKDGAGNDLTQQGLMNEDNIKVYVTDAKGKHFVYGNGADESPTDGRDFDFSFRFTTVQNKLTIIAKSKQTGVFENSIEVITTIEGKDYSHTYTVNQNLQ